MNVLRRLGMGKRAVPITERRLGTIGVDGVVSYTTEERQEQQRRLAVRLASISDEATRHRLGAMFIPSPTHVTNERPLSPTQHAATT